MNEQDEFVFNQILQLTEQIAELKFKRESLMQLLKSDKKPTRKPGPKKKAAQPKREIQDGRKRVNPNSRSSQIMAIFDASPEQGFMIDEIIAAVGCDKKQANSSISHLLRADKVRRVGKAKYQSSKSETMRY